LSLVRAWGEWDWESAETAFQQAFKLNPNYPDAHAYYSHYLAHMGRTDEALPYMERALELDPLNPLFHALYGVVLVYNRRFDEALAAASTAKDMWPGIPIAGSVQQDVFIAKGMRDEQLAHQRQRIAPDPERVAAFERGLEEGGYEGAQRGIADVLAARYGKSGWGEFGASGIAFRYLDAGDYDLAIDWLEKAYDEHDPNLPYIGLPAYDPLRSYPRFKDLLRRIGLPFEE
jgi:tetratricopeptide (TPR) repeat protein